MIPIFRVEADGRDITDAIKEHLVSLTVTDNSAMEADTLEIAINDPGEKRLGLPKRGATLKIYLGWSHKGLVEKGTYQIDKVSHSGPPDQISLSGSAAEFQGAIKENREVSYHETDLAGVLGQIAGRYDWQLAIEPALGAIPIDHLDQGNKSDLDLITTLGDRFGAVATIKEKRLVFIPIGHPVSLSGVEIPVAVIQRNQGDRHDFSEDDAESYSGVKAKWRRFATSTTVWELAGEEGKVRALKEEFPNQAEALKAAQAELATRDSQQATLTIDLAVADPLLIANQPIRVAGYRSEIDAIEWLIKDIRHTLDASSGFTSAITAERKL